MTTKLTQLRASERRGTLWQIAVLDVVRLLVRSGADHLDAAATWSALAAEASRRASQHSAFAIAEGDSYAEVARALGISRQAAAKRYRALSVGVDRRDTGSRHLPAASQGTLGSSSRRCGPGRRATEIGPPGLTPCR